MKIAVSSTGDNLDAMTDPRFGRCASFVIVDTDTLSCEAVPNPGAAQGQGAGIVAAQTVASKGVDAVIAGSFGPNAFGALNAGGIRVYSWVGGTIRQAVEALQSGVLQVVSAANVQAHHGMAQGTAPGVPPAGGVGRGGAGRGMRHGRSSGGR